MTPLELAERLDSMALVAELPVTCPMPCCNHVRIRAASWPPSSRAELRAAAKLLREMSSHGDLL